jgi:hypothetical protein
MRFIRGFAIHALISLPLGLLCLPDGTRVFSGGVGNDASLFDGSSVQEEPAKREPT